ncbi:2Fe-2S iron-sulfur cluster-binding protein [Brevibacterium casei]|uniref:(2Fe-2S)-binding protein n=1 Tax=Brevibacterium casei TaxID=33889 RepID=A0A7T4A156_9MICO|nr:2Fe-2S iron-sulfur cluster-binding protein [Brevibacterium casei]QQB15423.1 (2Fe-2S)-binding protein [Brevibacterium casei]
MSETVTARFDDAPLTAPAGASVAAALLASGRTSWRTTRTGRQRGLFCGIGVCFDCLVEIDGQTGQRACLVTLADGMDVRSHRGAGEAGAAGASGAGASGAGAHETGGAAVGGERS